MATACRSLLRVGSYTSEEQKCFMAAEKPEDWSKCTFSKTSAVGMYQKAADPMISSVDSMCGKESASDDDDAPKKKKKKKKSADDDD